LEQILHLLEPRELKVGVEVCRRWREVGEAAVMWSWVAPRLTVWNLTDMVEALATRRLRGVRRVEVGAVWVEEEQVEEVVQVLAEHPSLREVVMEDTSLAMVAPSLLASLTSRLEVLELVGVALTREQAAALVGGVLASSTLSTLTVTHTDLSSVEPALLASAVSLVDTVDLSHSSLTGEQVAAILAASLPTTSLTSLTIGGFNKELDSTLVARASTAVKTLRLG